MSNTIDVKMLQAFRSDFKEVVKVLEQKYGCDINLGKISYTDVDFTLSVKAVKRVNGKTGEQVEFEKYCNAFGLKPSDYGRRVKSADPTDAFVLVGFNLKARKYPYVAKSMKTGSKYKLATIDFI